MNKKVDRVQKHIDQWKHNRQFARTIEGRFKDWQVTVIFYAALHAVSAALESLGESVSSHTDRNNKIKSNASFGLIRSQYLDLYRIAHVTRYSAEADLWLPQEFLTTNDVVETLLKPIENGINARVPEIKFADLTLKT